MVNRNYSYSILIKYSFGTSFVSQTPFTAMPFSFSILTALFLKLLYP